MRQENLLRYLRNFLTIFLLVLEQFPQDLCGLPLPIRFASSLSYPATGLLFWGVKPALEKLLNPGSPEAVNKDGRLWERYQSNRANYLVSEGVKLISEILKHGQSYQNLKYQFDEDGQLKEYDLDGLILYDRCPFLIEGKAGRLTQPAQRGAPER